MIPVLLSVTKYRETHRMLKVYVINSESSDFPRQLYTLLHVLVN